MDLRAGLGRKAGVRKVFAVLVMVATATLAATAVAGGDRATRPVSFPGQLSAGVPVGWHVLHGWLSDVVDPAPRIAVASFAARLSRQTCACGFPNVQRFPRDGAFVFVWEYLHASRWGLARTPRRPGDFNLAGPGAVRHTCDGPTATFGFKDAGRIFQVAVYLGPRSSSAVRGRVTAMLDSLRVTPAE
jgi:hypothetical protein